MIPYVLHVALLISVCLLFYKILLQKETFYHLNRWVLLACLGLTFLLPLIRVPQQWALRKSQQTNIITAVNINHQPEVSEPVVKVPEKQAAAVTAAPSTDTSVKETIVSMLPQLLKWVLVLYWCGVAALGFNFLLQVAVLLRQAYKSPAIQDGQFRIIELDTDKAPCSFGNYIFINPAKYDWETYSQILLHEKIHIKQGHSFDLLLAELMLVFQWFNPFAWLYRKELENNLEFLTDNDVLNNNEVGRELYQMSLLKVSVPNLSLRITTNYNQSLLKKRIVMMNAKKSNIHTTWKYFFLLPLMAFLMCAFNEPMAYRAPVVIKSQTSFDTSDSQREGVWSAKITDNKLDIEFRNEGDSHNHMSNSNFLVSEFSALPRGTAGDFKLVREAGTMNFNGKFDGNKGSGRYQFVTNPAYIQYLTSQGITDIEQNDELAFFMINIKKDYVAMLHRNGYKKVSKSDLIATAALGVTEPYIASLKKNGFPDASLQDLITGKAMGIDGAFISEIRKAGYPNVSFDKLVSFKAQGINGQYIAKFKNARATTPGKKNTSAKSKSKDDSADDMIAYKALNVDESFVNGFKKAGYTNLSSSDLIGMKAVGVTPEYALSFKSAGYGSISHDDLVSMKALGITPEYLNSFKNAGFKVNADKAAGLKALGVTPEFINSFKGMGFSDISLDDATALKALGITPEYITEMRGKGFKSNDINKYITMKSAF
jgi:beta-lactamase regulating signal transducer with metallopeptidase domain